MGIQGLLPILRPVIEDAHVREFKGKKLGIDTFAWLHKAAFTCAYELGMNIKTDKYITFIMQRIQMMRSHGVEPLMVFDGCAMPAKKVTNDQRGRLRAQHHARGMAHAQDGNRAAATDCFQAAIRITPEMTRNLQKKLCEEGVEFIVAPYEADVQLAYLSTHGYVDAVVTEDSDLVVYGAKRIFLKMDKHGAGQLFCQNNLGSVESPNISSFTNAMFTHMCILAGCDMLPSMPGMGIRTAAQLVRDYKSMDRVFAAIRSRATSFSMPDEYEDTFWKCVLTFKHGRAYDPKLQKMCYLTPPPQNWDVDVVYGDDVQNVNGYLGPPMSPETARSIATGALNPRTLEPYSPPCNASDAAKAPFRAIRKKPATVQVARVNRSITSYLQNEQLPSEPKRKCDEPQRNARKSRPITPACSPEVAKTRRSSDSSRPAPQRVRTANPFVDPGPPPCTAPRAASARDKAQYSTSRFFAPKQKPAGEPAPAAAVAAAITGTYSSSTAGVVLVPESPLKSEMKPSQQQHDMNEHDAGDMVTEGTHDTRRRIENVFSEFRHEGSGGKVENTRPPVLGRKRPRMHAEHNSGTNGGSFVYRTSAERRAAALEKWGYKPPAEPRVTQAPAPGIVVANVRSAAGPSDVSPECDSSSSGSSGANATCGGREQQVEKSTDLSSIEAFRFSGASGFPLEASRRQHFPLEASRRAISPISHEKVDDIEDLKNFAHRPQPLHQPTSTNRHHFPLQISSNSSNVSSSSEQLRRPWPGAGIDDFDDDEIEEDPIHSGVDAAGAHHAAETVARRRRSSIEDGIETSDDEGVQHTPFDPNRYGENCASTIPFATDGARAHASLPYLLRRALAC